MQEKKNFVLLGKFFVLGREYLPSAINVLTNNSKILDASKTDIFQLTFRQRDETIP